MNRYILLIITIFLATFYGYGQMFTFPMTWNTPVPNGYMTATLHEDGRLTSCTRLGCFNCGGYGACSVCRGTGGQVWGYDLGVMPCGACGGTGRCGGCGGKGYSEFNASTQYGVTVIVDDNGNVYLDSTSGAGSAPSSVRRKSREGVEVIEYTSTYGVSANEHVYCQKCGKTMARHIHVKKY